MADINSKMVIEYWISSSDTDHKAMLDLFNTKNYHWSLFMGHLVIEKLIKALFVKANNEHPPYIHDLRRLLELTDIKFDDNKKVVLDSITRFNINARYDDYKQNFYNLCTEDFAKIWIKKIEEIVQWIKLMF